MINYKQLATNLDEWIHINIADDIYRTTNRPEYAEFVTIAKASGVSNGDIPRVVHGMLLLKVVEQESSFMFKVTSFFKGMFNE